MKNSVIHIKENSIDIGKYLRYALSAYLKSWWWAYVLPLALCLALSVVNINFIFAAVVLLFLVFTMILFFVVIYYGLVPESRYSTMKKEMNVSDDGITLFLKKPIVKEENEDDTPEFKIEEVKLQWELISAVKGTDECLLLQFVAPKYSFLAIPYDAFDDENHLKEMLSIVRTHIG